MSSFATQPKTILQALVATLALASIAAAQNATSTAALTLNGSATLTTGPHSIPVLWLTPAQQGQAGSAFTTNRVVFGPKYRFLTFFQFQMTDPGPDGASDGMTFTIQTQSANALGASGGDLGYTGITPSVAVEFDTWDNGGTDINDNHVAVLTDGQLIDLDPQTPYGVTNCQPPAGLFGCMDNGDLWSVWIDYDGTNLNVAVADNSTTRPANLISYPIDLPTLLGQDSAFVGFTAGTGAGYENHYVLNWLFPASPADAKK
jgi:hypothetical protein